MPRHKSIPRARATPRQIRDIKPKRQLPRSQRDAHDDWWQETEETNNNGDATNVSRGHETTNVGVVGSQEPGCENETTHGSLHHWYHHTSRLKKVKQFFWIFILYYALKLIYVMDLDNNYPLAKWQSSYDTSFVQVKPMGKSVQSTQDINGADVYSPKSSYLREPMYRQYPSNTKTSRTKKNIADAIFSYWYKL